MLDSTERLKTIPETTSEASSPLPKILVTRTLSTLNVVCFSGTEKKGQNHEKCDVRKMYFSLEFKIVKFFGPGLDLACHNWVPDI